MTTPDIDRLVAWSDELRAVHGRLRDALRLTRDALDADAPTPAALRDLLLYCHGFCTALDGHHRGEDRTLFPAIEAAHPELAPVLRSLERDHGMIGHLVAALQAAVADSAAPDDLARHLDGIGAIMENHFRYEENKLLAVLMGLALDVEPADALGPL